MLVGSAFAASFDCDPSPCKPGVACFAGAKPKKFSNVEKLICSDSKASLLDEKISGLYWLVKEISPKQSNKIIIDQKKWMKDDRDKCETIECVISAYERRYKDLVNQLSKNLKPLPKYSAWHYSTPATKAPPNSYCAISGEKEAKDDFDIELAYNNQSVCGLGNFIINCGYKVDEINPIGYIADGVGWLEFDGLFNSNDSPNSWMALIATTGEKLYWKVVRKKEGESYIFNQAVLFNDKNPVTEESLQYFKSNCPNVIQASEFPKIKDIPPNINTRNQLRGTVQMSFESGKHYNDIPVCVSTQPIMLPKVYFPSEALSKKTIGNVRVAIQFTNAGKVYKKEVISSNPPGIFDASALAATSYLNFISSTGMGRDPHCQIIMRYEYNYHDE